MLGVIVTKKNDKFWHTNCYTKVAAQINAKKRVSLSYHPGVAAPGFFFEDSSVASRIKWRNIAVQFDVPAGSEDSEAQHNEHNGAM